MSKKDWGRKTTQVVWEDLRPWVEQLWGSHGVMVTFKVYVQATATGLKPVVALEAYRPRLRGQDDVLKGRWEGFDATMCGAAAAVAVRLASRLLLDLDEEKERAERRAALL